MCEFISWIEAKMPDNTVQVLFLKDEDVYSSYGRDKLKGCRDNDYIGHGAIRTYFDLDTSPAKRTQYENKEFWKKENFPPEIARYLESPETFLNTWGKMIQTCFQPDDAYFVLTHAPEPWLSALFDIMVDWVATDVVYSYCVLRKVKGLTKIQKDKLVDRVATDTEYSYDILDEVKGLTEAQKNKLKKASKQT